MRSVRDRLLIFTVVMAFSVFTFGQKITVKGGFVEDSLQIGENIHFWLSAQYPENLEILLPDTNYQFSPFEYFGKSYFNSQLEVSNIRDSAVYILQSYEIDLVQYLSMPAFLISSKGDTTIIESNIDSIYFFELAPQVSDTTQLKSNLALQDVSKEVNLPVIGIILIVIGCIAAIVFLVFGKKIRRRFQLKKLQKEYIKFSERLTENIRHLKSAPSQKLAEQTLTEWKIFLERLEKKPISKLTTKEIMALEYTSELNSTLRNIDRCVYGGHVSDSIYKDFQAIEDFTQHRYSVITDQIKNS